MINRKDIIEIRDYLAKNLADYDGIFSLSELGIDSELIDEILFRKKEVAGRLIYKTFALPKEINAKIDFRYISLRKLDAKGVDFSEYNNILIDPQTVRFRDLTFCKFKGVTFERKDVSNTMGFYDVSIYGADFTGSHGAVINPQKILDKDLRKARLCDVEITGSFDHAKLDGTSFKGSRGASIDLDLCKYNKDTDFTDAHVFNGEKTKDELFAKIKSKLKK